MLLLKCCTQYASKVILKILQAKLQQSTNYELSEVQAGFRKGSGTRDPTANIRWIIRKTREFQKKHLLLLCWLCQSLWPCGSQQTGKFFKRWECQNTLPAFWEICMQVKKQQLEPDMEQQTSSKLGKEYVKAVYCHPAYLTYMQSISCKMPGWMKHKLESRLPGDISVTSNMQTPPPLWQKVKQDWEPLDESERREWKSWLETQHSKNEDHGIWSHHFMANRWGNSDRLFSWAPKSLQMVTAAMKLKDVLSLEEKLWPT